MNNITGAIIVTHASFSEGLKEALEMILGKQEYIESVVLREGDGLFDLKEKIFAVVKKWGLEDNIIFVDLFGATPFNAASLLCAETGIPVVTGVNMPVLFEFLSARECKKANEMEADLSDSYHNSFHFVKQNDVLNN